MTLSVNAKTYTADSFTSNKIGYTGPAHTGSVKDYISLGRVYAKPTLTFSGVARTEAKLTRTLTMTGALTATHDAIMSISFSWPTGAAPADIELMCTDAGAWIATQPFKNHVKNQLVNL